jgi:hypothetical protein
MITNPSQKYSKLFTSAYALLDSKDLLREETKTVGNITSLEEYFTYIGELKKEHETVVQNIVKSGSIGGDDWNARFAQYAKYLMLPINEDYFVINANTRTISIPAIFSANGVGLAGDAWAETLMFEIDRYFDYVDLATTKICVNWVLKPTDKNGEVLRGISYIDLVDLETEPGKLRFGWPMTSAMTKVEGTLNFAVTFFSHDDED